MRERSYSFKVWFAQLVVRLSSVALRFRTSAPLSKVGISTSSFQTQQVHLMCISFKQCLHKSCELNFFSVFEGSSTGYYLMRAEKFPTLQCSTLTIHLQQL